MVGFVSFCCCAHNRQQRLCFRVSPPPPTLLLFLCFFPARVTGRREGRKRRGCALLLCLAATTMAGDHGNVHVVNSKQLWETKVEDAKSRGKIVSESLLCLSLSLNPIFNSLFLSICLLTRKQTCGKKKKKSEEYLVTIAFFSFCFGSQTYKDTTTVVHRLW